MKTEKVGVWKIKAAVYGTDVRISVYRGGDDIPGSSWSMNREDFNNADNFRTEFNRAWEKARKWIALAVDAEEVAS